MKNRTCVMALCFLLVAVSGILAGCAKKKANEDYSLVIGTGVVGGLCAAPFYIAFDKGYFDEEGIKYTEHKIESGQGPQLLTTGQIDVTHSLLASLVQPIVNGLDVKITLGIHTGCIKVLVLPDSPIKTAADLKGKKIGTSGMAASSTVITQRYLAEIGVGVSAENLEVEWAIYQNSDLGLALEKGQVDAIALTDPTAAILENAGKGRAIINSATDAYLKDEFCCVVVARSQIVKDHPELIAGFTRAIQRASKFVQENPDETAQILADNKYVAGDPVVNANILRTYNYRAAVDEVRIAIERNANDLKKIGLIGSDVDPKKITENTFIALKGVPDTLYKK